MIVRAGYGDDLDDDYNIRRNDDLEAIIETEVVEFVTASNDLQLATFADLVRQAD